LLESLRNDDKETFDLLTSHSEQGAAFSVRRRRALEPGLCPSWWR
jgi:hypothetical protein